MVADRATRLLRRGKRRRSKAEQLLGGRRPVPRDPEIQHMGVSARIHEHVRRFQVAVNDARRVHVVQRREQRQHGQTNALPPAVCDLAGELLAFDQWHHDIRQVVDDPFVDQRYDPRSLKQPEHRQLASPGNPVAGSLNAQHFQRGALTGEGVIAGINIAEPPAPERCLYNEPTADDEAGRQLE